MSGMHTATTLNEVLVQQQKDFAQMKTYKKSVILTAVLASAIALTACASPKFTPRDTGGGHQGQSDTDSEKH